MRLSATSIALLLSAAPAAADDVTIAAGRAAFEASCAPCHGATGENGTAGDIRGLPPSVVARATRGMEQMPTIALTEEELQAIVAYLQQLWER